MRVKRQQRGKGYKMTEQQYKEYEKIKQQITPLKSFLTWCGNRYHGKYNGKYPCRLLVNARRIFVELVGIGVISNETYELPKELQEEIIEVIEKYVERKEKELEQI